MKTIYLPAETLHIPFEELAHLIADALWPETGPDDPRENYGFSRVGLDSELELAVKNGTLPVKNPLTFGPHTYPVGNALRSALVTVDDLRGFVAERGLSVLVEAPEQAAPAHSDEKARAQVQYMLMLSNSLKNSVSPEQAEKVAKFDEVSRALSLGDTNPTEAPRPALSPAPAEPVLLQADIARTAWSLNKPERYRGYTKPLHRLLAAAHREGEPCPTPRDVLEEWRINPPPEIAQVLTDSIDYYDNIGNTKSANLGAIRKAINRMKGGH